MPEKLFRLNQAIAKTGYCSRRKADELIETGQVKVNGKTVHDFSFLVNPGSDELRVNGQILTIARFAYVAMYKPRGIVTTCHDEKGRRDILDLLPANLRHLRPVGRLDLASEGLIILTNDGELTQKVSHPVNHLPKRYEVTVKGQLTRADLNCLRQGMELSDGPTLPAQAKLIGSNERESIFELVISEGRNRQIRRMCDKLGLPVIRLIRLGIGRLQLGQMTPGKWRYLTDFEIKMLGSS